MATLRTKISQQIFLTLDSMGQGAKKSSFQKTGKLTAEEFVIAGDFLVENFPSWSWGSGLPEKQRKHLPPDKQFLQTKNVPCFPREEREVEERVLEGDGDDGWVETTIQGVDDAAVEELPDDAAAAAAAAAEAQTSIADEDIDEDFDNVESLDDDFEYEGPSVVEDNDAAAADTTSVRATRRYDISIHYDTHYSTPRVWLYGYGPDGQPLKDQEWESDFSKEHLHKTVTFEAHPHLGFSCPSIHPCKHAEAMKNMIEQLSGQNAIDVKYYMVIFLKFIQAIVPTIQYDFTSTFQITRPDDSDDDACAASNPAAAGGSP
jgi:ubiquitin-like-conjugating enzyme ATG3